MSNSTAHRPTYLLSGSQTSIAANGYTATIASVGATLRELAYDSRPLVVSFAADEVRPFYRGAILAPWPNRVIDGTYAFDGSIHELPWTEPSRQHALHGLAAWLNFSVTAQTPSAVTLTATIEAQAGYPYPVRVDVRYMLDADGLHTTVTGTNLGTAPAPWGTGPHPYLVAGEGRVDDWELTLPADRVYAVTGTRLLPTALGDVGAVAGGTLDFRVPRTVDTTFIDHAYTGLAQDEEGTATVTLRSPAGTGVRMTWDAACPWVQIHTADQPDPHIHRIGLAVEPMTCPPDAFNTGTDLVTLEPGSSSSAGWTISAL